jgi:5-methyltetrahydropteroyltriglutamate--homocysteine methyltransferase
LFETIFSSQARTTSEATLEAVFADLLRSTISRLEQTGLTVITDGEQAQPSFATYPLSGLANIALDGAIIPFADSNTRQVPRLTVGPFRYRAHAAAYVWGPRRSI